ncbi:MAG TPA: SDR family NAD(P)-dependent oxidoreductase [Acidothermaceae bacterium]
MKARIAIVAGAGSGIGHATALALHAAGLTVVAVDRTEAGLKELPDGIHREVADATDPAVPGPLVEHVVAEIGAPDVLVNTIGAYELGDALTVTPQTLGRMMDVNLGAALWLTQAVARHMKLAGSGVIVHVAAPARRRTDGRRRCLWREQGRAGAPDAHPRRRATPARDPGQYRRPAAHRHGEE